MNLYLRQDIENIIEEYWHDVHKNKWMKVSKHCVHATRKVLFILNRCSDLNILECQTCFCDRDYIYYYGIFNCKLEVRVVPIKSGILLEPDIEKNIVLKEYIQEIRTRYKFQGK